MPGGPSGGDKGPRCSPPPGPRVRCSTPLPPALRGARRSPGSREDGGGRRRKPGPPVCPRGGSAAAGWVGGGSERGNGAPNGPRPTVLRPRSAAPTPTFCFGTESCPVRRGRAGDLRLFFFFFFNPPDIRSVSYRLEGICLRCLGTKRLLVRARASMHASVLVLLRGPEEGVGAARAARCGVLGTELGSPDRSGKRSQKHQVIVSPAPYAYLYFLIYLIWKSVFLPPCLPNAGGYRHVSPGPANTRFNWLHWEFVV